MAATIKDIANLTGLGLATISKYLNGGSVRPKNKEAIEAAIKELNFTVNGFARGLKTSQSKTIGIVIDELSNVFITSIVTVIVDILWEHGYAAIVCDSRTDEMRECEAVESLVSRMVDGIISMSVCQDGRHLRPAIEKKLPIVLVDRALNHSIHYDAIDAVIVDNVQAAQSATELLIANGHEKIGILVGASDMFTAQQRLLGYRQALINRGFCPDDRYIQHCSQTVVGGQEGMKKLLARRDDMTAVLVTNYETTLGALIALKETEHNLPQDLSFVGFDIGSGELHLTQLIQPRPTVVTQPLAEIGRKAAELIIDRLNGAGGGGSRTITLSTTLQQGESVRNLSIGK